MAKQSKNTNTHVRKETFWLVTLLALAVGFFGGVMFAMFKSDTVDTPGRQHRRQRRPNPARPI